MNRARRELEERLEKDRLELEKKCTEERMELERMTERANKYESHLHFKGAVTTDYGKMLEKFTTQFDNLECVLDMEKSRYVILLISFFFLFLFLIFVFFL